jgi:type VI secretion system secreted protein Hcp
MAIDAFLNIDGIQGDSTDDKHKGWIEVLSFSWGATNPSSATASSSGGGTTERVTLDDLVVMKHIDKSSPKIHEAVSKGTHFATVTLQLHRAGGDKIQYYEVKMEQVIISSAVAQGVSMGTRGSKAGDTGGKGSPDYLPVEDVSFNFGKIKWTYTQQKRADGSGGGNTTGGWDATANKIAS